MEIRIIKTGLGLKLRQDRAKVQVWVGEGLWVDVGYRNDDLGRAGQG